MFAVTVGSVCWQGWQKHFVPSRGIGHADNSHDSSNFAAIHARFRHEKFDEQTHQRKRGSKQALLAHLQVPCLQFGRSSADDATCATNCWMMPHFFRNGLGCNTFTLHCNTTVLLELELNQMMMHEVHCASPILVFSSFLGCSLEASSSLTMIFRLASSRQATVK